MPRFKGAVLVLATIGATAGGLVTIPTARAQRYLVNDHLATAAEARVLEAYGFNAGAWRMDGWGISQDPGHAEFIPEPRIPQCHYVLDVPLDCETLIASR